MLSRMNLQCIPNLPCLIICLRFGVLDVKIEEKLGENEDKFVEIAEKGELES